MIKSKNTWYKLISKDAVNHCYWVEDPETGNSIGLSAFSVQEEIAIVNV